MPGPMGGMRGGSNRAPEKAKDFTGTVKKLIKNYLSPYNNSINICYWKYNIFNSWT